MITDYAVCWENKDSTSTVEKRPNDFGLYDMYGNVWEWCLDIIDDDYYLRDHRETTRHWFSKPATGGPRGLLV